MSDLLILISIYKYFIYRMAYCSAIGCSNKSSNNKNNIKFFGFPKDTDRYI